MTLTEIKERFNAGTLSYDDTMSALDSYIAAHPEDEEAYTWRGLRYWSAGNRSAAINDYLAAIRINPDSKANLALKSANEILDYYNKDLYNP